MVASPTESSARRGESLLDDARISVTVTWVAAIIAAVVALVSPTGYFLLSHEAQVREATIAARLHATFVTQVIQGASADWRKDVVPVRDFPRVDDRREDFLVLPEVKRVLAPLALHHMRMSRDGQPALPVRLRDDLHEVERRIDRRFQIHSEQMTRRLASETLLVELQSRHHEHIVFAPREKITYTIA